MYLQKKSNKLKKNIYLFYTGGLKREIHIINNLIYKFHEVHLTTIDTDISKIKKEPNIIIKKIFLIKIILFILNSFKVNFFLKSYINLIGLFFIDLFFSIYLLKKNTNPKDIIICENNICKNLLKIAKFKKLISILDVSNIHLLDKYKIMENVRGDKISFAEQIIINRGLSEYKLANKITVLSTNVLNSFKKHKPEYFDKIHLVQSGVDTNLFFKRDSINEYSICIVGAISKYKNSHILFKLLNSINDIKLKILIIGNFDATMSKILIPNHLVIHKQYVKHHDLPKYYSSSKILCIASYIEGMPKVVLEASACGTPVIGFQASSIDDIVFNKKNGYVIENENFTDFKNKIILSLKEDLSKMQIFGQNFIKENYKLEHYAKRLNKLFLD